MSQLAHGANVVGRSAVAAGTATVLTEAATRLAVDSSAPRAVNISYRADIDGLRGVAVLAVIGFHAASQFVPGGFVGVDVFFVISGFLISTQLFQHLQAGTFSLRDFYARRIRRIFPALIVVLLACGAFGWYALVQDEFSALQKHLAASASFTNNIVLWREEGYFDAPSSRKPLLHLWSLGVEEQFYLIWPALVALCWKRGFNLATAAAGIVFVSFLFNIVWTRHDAAAAFYLPHTRLWQLLLGGTLAAASCFHRRPALRALNRVLFASNTEPSTDGVRSAAGLLGMGLIMVSIVALDRGAAYANWWSGGSVATTVQYAAELAGIERGAAYPGWSALAPTIGTALLIAAGPKAWVNRRLLARRVPVFIGLISYPLYLWHWPLLSFLDITELGAPSRALKVAAIVLAFILATLTYVCVERPVRRSISGRTVGRLALLTAPLVLIGVASFVSYRTEALLPRVPHMAVVEPYPLRVNETLCRQRFPSAGEYCSQYSTTGSLSTVLLGDSHAAHLFGGLGEHLASSGENLVLMGQSGCPPLFDLERVGPRLSERDRCTGVNHAVLDAVRADAQIHRVVLSFRGAEQVSGRGFGEIERETEERYRIAGTSLSNGESIRLALARTVGSLLDRGKEVWIAMQVPELGFDPMECTGRPFSFSHRPVRSPCGVETSVVLDRQAEYRAILSAVQAQWPSLQMLDPIPYLCNQHLCAGLSGNQLLYVDSNHLSLAGSRLVAAGFSFAARR